MHFIILNISNLRLASRAAPPAAMPADPPPALPPTASLAPPANQPTTCSSATQCEILLLREEVTEGSHCMDLVSAESADTNCRIWRLEQMMHAMCQQHCIDLGHIDTADIANPAMTAEAPSPLMDFWGLSISQGGPGERTSSAHSSAPSTRSSKSSDLLKYL
jgi:hypothetical protein